MFLSHSRPTLEYALLFAVLFFASCNKEPATTPEPPDPQDTTVVTKPDTILLVRKIEEYFTQSSPARTSHLADISFYYDKLKRVTQVGFRNYNPMFIDSITSYFFYNGNSMKPYKVVQGNNVMQPEDDPRGAYDTLYVDYDSNGRVVKDSSFKLVQNIGESGGEKMPLIRSYTYPDANKQVIYWTGQWFVQQRRHAIRTDTVYHNLEPESTHAISTAVIPGYIDVWAQDQLGADDYSDITNPLGVLNISGTVFSIIHQTWQLEIWGQGIKVRPTEEYIIPHYFDYLSATIPHNFNIGARLFDITVAPLNWRSNYPEQISVGSSESRSDRVTCRYFY